MKVKNFNKHQHFKDRRPPWIKLYRDILEQRDINLISDRSFRVLIYLWLIASEDDAMEGNLPSVDDISFKTRIEKSQIIKCLAELEPFIEHDDIKEISRQYQVDLPEKRRGEAKTYKEETEHTAFFVPDWIDLGTWNAFLECRKKLKAPNTEHAKRLLITKLEKLKDAGHEPNSIINTAIERGWKSVFEPDTAKQGRSAGYSPISALEIAMADNTRRVKPAQGSALAILEADIESRQRVLDSQNVATLPKPSNG